MADKTEMTKKTKQMTKKMTDKTEMTKKCEKNKNRQNMIK